MAKAKADKQTAVTAVVPPSDIAMLDANLVIDILAEVAGEASGAAMDGVLTSLEEMAALQAIQKIATRLGILSEFTRAYYEAE